jgi:hypothetical protein
VITDVSLTRLFQVLQGLAMIAGLVALVGALLYAFSWAVLSLVQFFPVIGRKHRHRRWEELNQGETDRARKSDAESTIR